MAIKPTLEIIPEIPIFYKGNFDMEPIYRSCVDWMNKQQVDFVYETNYKEKEIGPAIVDKEIKLEGAVKLDEFRRWNINIVISSWDTKTLDQIGPSGNNMYHGRLEILLGSTIETDYQGAYAGDSPIVSAMRKIVSKIWGRGNPGANVGEIAYKLQQLGTTCKQHLGLEVN